MRLPDSWSRARATLAIVAVTSFAWLVAAVLWLPVAEWGGFVPADFAAQGVQPSRAWITPLSATLIHAGPIHLAFNMAMLVFCGRPVEAVLGPVALALLYVLGAYAAAAGQYLVNPADTAAMVGASGAISAVLGAYAMLFGRNKVKLASPRLALLLNALWLLAAWVALNLMLAIILRGGLIGGAAIQVAAAAHIGGFLIGLILATPLLLFRYRKA